MKKIIIVGAGVSGLVAALNIKNVDNEVIILEKNEIAGKKILVSGNGRCNFLNDDFNSNHYHSVQKNDIDFLFNDKSKNRIIDFINKLGIEYKIKNGYYYPFTNKAKTIWDALLNEINNRGIKIIYNYNVEKIEKKDLFIINEEYECDYLLLSMGSKSYVKNENSYSLVKNLGHSVTGLYPSLVQITGQGKYFKEMSGVRTDVKVGIYDNEELVKEEYGELQLTDYGISGICVFNLSRYVSLLNNPVIKINFLPFIDTNISSYLLNRPNIDIYNMLSRILNESIVKVILKLSNIDKNKKYSELDDKEKDLLNKYLTSFEVIPTGTKGFENSQVTAGGVNLSEVDLNTFESKIISNLYLTGELLDIDGDCGGYNIGFAILSGLIASDSIRGKND